MGHRHFLSHLQQSQEKAHRCGKAYLWIATLMDSYQVGNAQPSLFPSQAEAPACSQPQNGGQLLACIVKSAIQAPEVEHMHVLRH